MCSSLPDATELVRALSQLQGVTPLQLEQPGGFSAWLEPLLQLQLGPFALIAEWVESSDAHGFLRVLAAHGLSCSELQRLGEGRAGIGAAGIGAAGPGAAGPGCRPPWCQPLDCQPGPERAQLLQSAPGQRLDHLLREALQHGGVWIADAALRPENTAAHAAETPGCPATVGGSFMALPLLLDGQRIGLLCFAGRAGGYDPALAASLLPVQQACASQLALVQERRRHAQLELGLRQGRSRHEAIWDSTGEALFVLTQEGLIESANSSASQLTGYSVAELTGRPFASLMRDDCCPGVQDYLHAGPGPHCHSSWLLDRAGSAVECELRLSALQLPHGPHFICVVRDLRAQRQQERELNRLSRELDAILAVCPDGVVAFDARQQLSYCNPAFGAMVGWSRDSVAGMSLEQFEQRLAGLAGDGQTLPALCIEQVADLHLHLQHPRSCVLSCSVRHIGHDGGAGVVLYFRDVTRESEIDRMKTEFLSTAAHELRTPLASIFGFAELMLQRQFDADTQRDLIHTIYRQSQTLIKLINELLDIARIEARAGKFFSIAAHDAAPLIAECVEQMQAQHPERQIVLEAAPMAMPPVLIDPGKFVQILQNILSNALKYSARPRPVVVRQLLDAASHPGQAGVQVEDFGIGMTLEQLERVFERFWRANPHGPVAGSGLGMSLVREIIDVLGGNITIHSRPGDGTRVTVWLPLAETAP